jgi:hypothetical protein
MMLKNSMIYPAPEIRKRAGDAEEGDDAASQNPTTPTAPMLLAYQARRREMSDWTDGRAACGDPVQTILDRQLELLEPLDTRQIRPALALMPTNFIVKAPVNREQAISKKGHKPLHVSVV